MSKEKLITFSWFKADYCKECLHIVKLNINTPYCQACGSYLRPEEKVNLSSNKRYNFFNGAFNGPVIYADGFLKRMWHSILNRPLKVIPREKLIEEITCRDALNPITKSNKNNV